jgi:hypothetical protein
MGAMNRLMRWIVQGAGAKVGRQEAVDIARRAAEERGLPWLEPVKVYRHYGDWAVWTYAGHRGGNVRIVVDAGSGEVKGTLGPTPR